MTEKSPISKLSNDNYEIWRVLMEAVLTRKGLHDVALGLQPRPLTGPNSPAGRAWEKKNAEARAEMILSVDVDQLSHMTAPDAADIWTELEQVHRARGFATRITLRRKFLTMKMKSDQRMVTWIGEVRSTAFQLTQIGVNLDDEDTILVLTMGLPSSYNTFIVALDGTDPTTLTLDYVIGRLLNEESRLSNSRSRRTAAINSDISDEAAAVTPFRRPLSQITCFGCGNKGHYQSTCPNKATTSGTKEKEVAGVVVDFPDSDSEGEAGF